MDAQKEIEQLKAEVAQLRAEMEQVKADGFRGTKADALLSYEYELIPDYLKSPRAIAFQKRVAHLVSFPAIICGVGAVIYAIADTLYGFVFHIPYVHERLSSGM